MARLIAMLDEQNRLVGYQSKARLAKDDIDAGDGALPTDGSYYWCKMDLSFKPIPTRRALLKIASVEDVVAEMISQATAQGITFSAEIIQWARDHAGNKSRKG